MFTAMCNKILDREVKAPVGLSGVIYAEQNLILLFSCFSRQRYFSTPQDFRDNQPSSWVLLFCWVICRNYDSYKHPINITIPPTPRNRLFVFPASSHSPLCHKYLLSLLHSSASTTAFEYFQRLPGLHQCFHSSGLITGVLIQLCRELQRKPPLIRDWEATDWCGIRHDFKANKHHLDGISW